MAGGGQLGGLSPRGAVLVQQAPGPCPTGAAAAAQHVLFGACSTSPRFPLPHLALQVVSQRSDTVLHVSKQLVKETCPTRAAARQ